MQIIIIRFIWTMNVSDEFTEEESDDGYYYVVDNEIISANRFILLSLATFGLYDLWWMYKAWRFFEQKEGLDIRPALRSVFAVFYLIPLFVRIQRFAGTKGYTRRYFSVLLFLGILAANLVNYLPFPAALLSLLSFIFIIPPFKALNFAKQNSSDLQVVLLEGFNTRQRILLIIGGFLWLPILVALLNK